MKQASRFVQESSLCFFLFFFFKFNLLSFFDFCFTFWLPWVFGAVSRGSSLAAAHRLLIAVASLAVERDH